MLVGRGPQRAAIDRAITAAAGGRSSALAFSGTPGIGKTALLGYAAERATGVTILRARGIESEAQIPFASLLELLRPVLPLLEHLAAPQAIALEQAFALRPGHAQDRFAVSAATLSLVAACAEANPTMLLLDDIQWFDAPSAEALRFTLRRLDADPVAAVLAVREHHGSLLDGTEIPRLTLEGLSADEARLLRRDIPGTLADRLLAVTGGNPLALLELDADPDELALAPEGAPALVSGRISAAYLRRAAVLDGRARSCLLLAATSDSGDLQLLARAAGLIDLDIDALLPAEDAGLVKIAAGRVEFQHPLVRSAVYSDATSAARREAHRALASVLPDHEIERRAWHLAAAAAGTDETASLALEHAAVHSLERGGHSTAAAAQERAARLTGDAARRAHLLARAAEAAWDAGAGQQAQSLLDDCRAAGAEGGARLAAERLAGRIATSHGPVKRGHAILIAAARLAASEADGAEEAISLLADAAVACFLACAAPELAETSAEAAKIVPRATSPAARLLEATIRGMALILGADAARGTEAFRLAAAIIDDHPELAEEQRLAPWIALGPLFLRELGAGQRNFDRALQSVRGHGGIGTLPFVLCLIGRDQATTERCRLAEATYREAISLARESDQRTWLAYALAGLAWVLARQGREAECRASAEEAQQLGDALGAHLPSLWALSALGELELALGRPARAIEQLELQRQLAHANAISDVDLWPAAEMVEAHVRLGHDDDARRLTTRFRAAAEAKGQPWSRARALRCEGLVAPADGFAERFEAALQLQQQTPDVYELARTRLAYGSRLRRHRNRVLARSELRLAADIFERIDARPWLEQALAELEATGETLRRGAPNTIDELTPQELQIAAMLASGRTTREAAAALFLSPKTIEYHLRHVYLKLDIHSREELAQLLG